MVVAVVCVCDDLWLYYVLRGRGYVLSVWASCTSVRTGAAPCRAAGCRGVNLVVEARVRAGRRVTCSICTLRIHMNGACRTFCMAAGSAAIQRTELDRQTDLDTRRVVDRALSTVDMQSALSRPWKIPLYASFPNHNVTEVPI